MRKTSLALVLTLCAGSASAAGTVTAAPASAASVAALTSAVNSLSARVSKLEAASTPAAAASLGALFNAGTYNWSGFQVGLGNAVVETISFNGTIVFSANGTFTYQLTEQDSDLGTGSALKPTSAERTDVGAGTWTVSGNKLTATTTDGTVLQFLGAASNHVLVTNITNNHATGTVFDKQLVILTRESPLL